MSEHLPESTPGDAPHPTAHELSDVDTRGLLTFLAIMVTSLAIVGAVVFWQYRRFEALALASDPAPAPRAGERQPPPLPHLQVDEPADMARLLSEQRPLLTKLEWVSREERIVRIPVERAMEIVATSGIPKWATEAPTQNSPPTEAPGQEPPP